MKDVVGASFENHRKRIWNFFGFEVSKDKQDLMYGVDWVITYKDNIVAFEEDKGHYLDSCFMERALSGFSKTINICKKKNKQVPILIIHSFTKYRKFNDKLEEEVDTRKEEIKNEIMNKLFYTTLTHDDRLPKNKWFSKNKFNCYSQNVKDDLIIKDIRFIQSLMMSFE